ncbi:MAG: Mobile element protein, partial [uncultured Chloroflexi bacterium]
PSPASAARWPRHCWRRSGVTCTGSPQRSTSPPGPGCVRATTRAPASVPAAGRARAAPGSARSSSKPPTPLRVPKAHTWRRSTGGWPRAGGRAGPRSRSATPSWSSPTTCSAMAPRTTTSARTTSTSESARRPSAAWSTVWKCWATGSPWNRSPP